MGNNGSRRKARRLRCRYKQHDVMEDNVQRDHDQSPPQIRKMEEPTPESYDKLLAWMVEMAENDDGDLESPAFVEHLTTVCAEKYRTPLNTPEIRKQHSLDVPVRQHSLESSGSSRYSRSSRSREDLLDPKNRFRRAMLSRQSTVDFSDDGEMPTISSENSFDSDNDMPNSDTMLLQNIGETSFSDRSMRPPLRKNQSCTSYRNISTSFGDLLNSGTRKKSKSLMTMRKMLSESRNYDEITPISEEQVVKVLGDNLLDRNMADILYSVEALWPKVPK
ncbi:hypothetical protein ACF0H5_002070 [Mactra antiquata]